MFTEPQSTRERKGWIEVICGPMFSGKTEELIRRLRRAEIANRRINIFKPRMDVRYHETNIVSHNANNIASIPVCHSSEILLIANEVDVVAVDEAQFFDEGILEVVQLLASKGIRVIVAGLDMDYQGKPFGPMPALLATAEYVTKLHAICMVCGDIASHSFRTVPNADHLLLGETDAYQARCRMCFLNGIGMQP
ncbi:thymidine kinase [soil metagenome]